MVEVASLIVVNLIIAAAIGFVIGYLIGKSSSSENLGNDKEIRSVGGASKKAKVNPIFRKNSSLDYKPLVLSTPRQSGADNFLKIRGIDEATEKLLNDTGIYHFDQISKWNTKNCAWIEEFLQFHGRIRKERWVEQAKILAEGNETEFSLKVENGEIDHEETLEENTQASENTVEK
jgi:predicted flap endonuclease-1-like 5' DNA nuclease